MRPLERLGLVLLAYTVGAAVLGARGGPVWCPARRLTGRPCPACGLTRSVAHLARGRWRRPVDAHPLGPAVLAASIALGGWVLTGRARHPDAPQTVRTILPKV